MDKVPSIWDLFAARYYQGRYLYPVDLSHEAMASRAIGVPGVKEVIAGVREVFAAPLSYDLGEVARRNAVVESAGFRILASKPYTDGDGQRRRFDHYSVVEHPNVPGWVIKAGGKRVPSDRVLFGPRNSHGEMVRFTPVDGLLRVQMAERIRHIAAEHGIAVQIPRKGYVALGEHQWVVVAEKLEDLPTVEQTAANIAAMTAGKQRTLARKIATLVKEVGMGDASFDNVRVRPDGELVMIDTEPAGVLRTKEQVWSFWKTAYQGSVEKCARIGLYLMMKDSFDLKPFYEVMRQEYEAACRPKLSRWRITAAVLSLGLLPLIDLVIAAVIKIRLEFSLYKLAQVERHEWSRSPWMRDYFDLTEGVLF